MAENNNLLRLFKTSEYTGEESSLKPADDYENGGSIDQIAVWKDSKFVTCSENEIILWNIDDSTMLKQLHNYR